MLYDISPLLSEATDVWPGDVRLSTSRALAMERGASVNVTTLCTTVQIGAHIESPLHFSLTGHDVANVALDACIGSARVITLIEERGITASRFTAVDLRGVERLVVRTRSGPGPHAFSTAFAYLDPSAAEYVGGLGLRLFGIDSYSVDSRDSKSLASHNSLAAAGIVILEGIELFGVPDGDYELIALPLRLGGCDASPVRAVLRA